MKILYFAWVRQKAGMASEEVAPPDDVRTVADLLRWLKGRDAAHADALGKSESLRVAVDQEHADLDTPIAGAREVAFFPPVTGG